MNMSELVEKNQFTHWAHRFYQLTLKMDITTDVANFRAAGAKHTKVEEVMV